MPRTLLGRIAAGLLAAFAALAVLVEVAGRVPGDGVLTAPPSRGAPRALALGVDALTGYAGTGVLTGILVVVPVRLGRRRDALLCAVSVAGALVGTTLLKHLVARPRPDLLPPSVAVSTFSFPSGHAAATAAVAVTLVLLVRDRRARGWVAALGVLLVLGTAAAQLLLALHWPSDIVGGWLLAAGWTTAVWAASGRGAAR